MVDLLAAIAIIAVLLAILLPSLSVAREASRRTACAANLAQCGRAFYSYAANYDGWVPRGSSMFDAMKPPWSALIAKELGLKVPFEWTDVAKLAALHCPSHPTEGPASHYVMNAFNPASSDGKPVGLTRLTSIRNAAGTPWLLETPRLFNRMTFYPLDDIFVEDARFVSSAEHLVGGASCRLATSSHGTAKSNVLFADGHVKVLDNAKLKLMDFLPIAR